jgi:hydrogenase maturation protease
VIGCGNILRGDDAVGPVLIRHLHTQGVPTGVRLVDGGTSGMDVAFGMRGAARVVIVDAATTGAEPGTVYRVPAEQLSDLPPIDGLHTHNFRWDHALAFSTWLLGPHRPTDITVFLVEAGQFEPGSELSAPVAAGMERVMALIADELYPLDATVEITDAGYLHLSARLAAAYFPADVCVARLDGDDLVLMPLAGPAHGGLVLMQRNPAGDRSLLIHEVLGFASLAGTFEVAWNEERGALHVLLSRANGDAHGDRGPDRGGAGARTVGGLPADPDAGGPRATTAAELHPRVEGPAGRRRDPADRGPQTRAEGVPR